MKIILIGMPGSGKSTQGNLLSAKLNIPFLSTGDIFRAMAQEDSDQGRYITEVINSGDLMPDEKTISIVSQYLKQPDYRGGYILDGFPRTVTQAENFPDKIDWVLYLTIDDDVALARLTKRQDKLRRDDTQETIKKRLDVFHKQTQPVLDFYKKMSLLKVIDGNPSVEEIHRNILGLLKFNYGI